MPDSDISIRDVSGQVAFAQVDGNLTGDIIAGNKTVITNIIQQAVKQIVTAPYKFLSSYDISDRDIFFGRNAIIEQLIGNFPRFKTLVINGRSGSGKTSLINAGLIPRLAENGYHYISFREYSDPLRQLQEHVRQDEVFRPFADATSSLRQFLATVTRQQQMPLVVIFDQFERFFVKVPAALRAQFIQEIKSCLLSDLNGRELDLVFALREDFFGAFIIEFETVIPTFFHDADRFNLLPLQPDEAREAILNPLRRVVYKIGYDKTFVDDVLLPGLMGESAAGTAIDPPHVQIVCNQLYQAACERHAAELEQGDLVQIDHALYTQLGETSGILRTYLDDFIDRAAHRDTGGRDVLRSMLKLMLDTTGTRKFVSFADLETGLPDVPAAAIEQHIREFQDGRIIETRGSGDAAHYSLSHEVMVEKVHSWFDERELERKKAQEILERGIAEWKTTQALLNEKQVEHIRKWLGSENLSAEAEQLLQDSQATYKRAAQEKAERERKLREEEDARRKAEKEYAEEQRKRAEEAEKHAVVQVQSVNRIKKLVAGLVVFLLIAIGAAIMAWIQQREAIFQKQEAQRQEQLARQAQTDAEHQSHVSLLRSMIAYAYKDDAQEDRERATLLMRHVFILNQRYHGGLNEEIEDALRSIFRTSAIEEGSGRGVAGDMLVHMVCQKIKLRIALTEEEWQQFVGDDISYEPACPELLGTSYRQLRREKMITPNMEALSLNLRQEGYYGYPIQDNKNTFQKQGKVIVDLANGLMWEMSGSDVSVTYEGAQAYIKQLNQKQFAGYDDWRLPTIEELVSILEKEKQSNDLYLNPIFETPLHWYLCWSVDENTSSSERRWVVVFGGGNVDSCRFDDKSFVRGVRSDNG